MKRIGYGKMGRKVTFQPQEWGVAGGDNEPPMLLRTLATRHPDVEGVMLAKNTGWTPPADLPNVVNPWQDWAVEIHRQKDLYGAKDREFSTLYKTVQFYDDMTFPTYGTLDGICMWIGQHGSANSPIKQAANRNRITRPQQSQLHYGSHITRGINYWRRADPLGREEIWLTADVRNPLTTRDLKWPQRHPLIAQFNFTRPYLCERYGDPRTPAECGFDAVPEGSDGGMWRYTQTYKASALELVGITPAKPWNELPDFGHRQRFGIVIGEARNYGMKPEMTRLHAMQHYVEPLQPDWVHGLWSPESQKTLGRVIKPLANDIYGPLSLVKSTFTTPSSGSEWATAKPWECFTVGAVCFFHPRYDSQGHILPTLKMVADGKLDGNDEMRALAEWLRVENPEQLKKRVDALNTSRDTWEWLAQAQHRYVQRAMKEQRCVKLIENRLGLVSQ
jgi:hypothetical protein